MITYQEKFDVATKLINNLNHEERTERFISLMIDSFENITIYIEALEEINTEEEDVEF